MSSIYTYDQVKEEFESRELELVSTEYSSAMQKLNFICPKHRDRGMQEIDLSIYIIGIKDVNIVVEKKQ